MHVQHNLHVGNCETAPLPKTGLVMSFYPQILACVTAEAQHSTAVHAVPSVSLGAAGPGKTLLGARVQKQTNNGLIVCYFGKTQKLE